MKSYHTVIIGGGYAGMAAAYTLSREDVSFALIEKNDCVGGLSRTFELSGSHFDLGPHTYFDRDEDAVRFWQDLIGEKLRSYERRSKLYYNRKFINSPLQVKDAIRNLGILPAIGMVASFWYSKIFRRRMKIENSKDWVVANFGEDLYRRFFKVYNEKIWGLDCEEVSHNWAGHRIKSSLFAILYKSFTKDKNFIVRTFSFPDRGSRTVFRELEERLGQCERAEIRYKSSVEALRFDDATQQYEVQLVGGEMLQAQHVISTMPIDELARMLFSPEDQVAQAAQQLRYRNLILCLINVDESDIRGMDEHWIDIHDPEVAALRVTNFGNYGCQMESPGVAPICVEYNCFESESWWEMSDEQIYGMACKDLVTMGLLPGGKSYEFRVVRFSKAYPLYFKGYEPHLETIKSGLAQFKGLQTIGRAGMYKWNNMHHSIKTGILSARNTLGEENDLWDVSGLVALGKDQHLDDDASKGA